MNKEEVIRSIEEAFGDNSYPGDNYLQGSMEGCEPYEEIAPFVGKKDWKAVEVEILDNHGGALSFFSQAGFRFFLPAFLIADLKKELNIADPLFHLTNGFYDIEVKTSYNSSDFTLKTGKSQLVNPKRYGAMTFYDYAQFKLSVFTREEVHAIIDYLKYKRDDDPETIDKESIEASLNLYWLDRTNNALSIEDLKEHIREQDRFLAAIDKSR
jgi:hypothetical protein